MPVTKKISRTHAPREEATSDVAMMPRKKKVCPFCTNKTEPSYVDSQALRKFMNDRAKIVPRQRSGVCSKHQRRLSKEIKHARHLALLPFIASI